MVEKSFGIGDKDCDVVLRGCLEGGEVVRAKADLAGPGSVVEETRKSLCGELIVSALFSLAEYSFNGELCEDGSKSYFLVKSRLKRTKAELRDALSRAGGLKDCIEMVKYVHAGKLGDDSDPCCVLQRGGGQFSCVLQLICKGGEVGVVEVIEYSFRTRKNAMISCVLYKLRRTLSEVGGPDPVFNMVKKLIPGLRIDDTAHQSIKKGRKV